VPYFHHVNLGVPPGGIDAQSAFLIDVIGFRRLELKPEIAAFGAHWFDDDDGIQIHLSADPEHRAPKRAHVAVSFDDLDSLQKRLEAADIAFTDSLFDGMRVLNCRDPSGNLWELRGALAGA
jgi:catechol 2,3-dioxygenase-like lactoylglutathione lyase family enzyme